MPYKDKQKQREYQRGWARRKRASLPTRTTIPLTDEERKERQREYLRNYRKKTRQKAEKVFGKKCFICNRERRLIYHKKDGKEHPDDCTARLALKNPEEYARLCEWCHKAIHWCMEYFNMTWEDIIERLKYLNKL